MNPYYIPRRRQDTGIRDLASLGLQLYGLKQHQALTEKELGLRGQTIDLQRQKQEAELGVPAQPATMVEPGSPAIEGTEQAKVRLLGEHAGIEKGNLEIAKAKAEEDKKANVDLANFGTPKAQYTANKLESLGIPKNHPLIEQIKAMGPDSNVTNAEAYQRLKNDYPSYRASLGEIVMQDYMKQVEKDPLYSKTPKGIAQVNFVNELDSDPTGEKVLGKEFQGTIAAMQRRQAASMTAQAHVLTAMKPQPPGSDIGKLQEDRTRYISQGYKEDSPIIKAIDGEMKKKSEATPPKVQSMGNAVDLAINKKFQDPSYLTDPEKQKEALKWLGTEEGKQAVRDAALDVTPPQVTYIQTAEGYVPAGTKGPGAGVVGKPTELTKPISPEQASKIGELNTLITNLDAVKKLYKPEWVGPVAGRIGGLQEKYTGGATEEQVKFYAYVRDIKDALLRARSGAQINEQEYARLVKFLPDETSPAKTFEARVERFKESLQTVLTSKKQALGEAGYGATKKSTVIKDPLGIR